MKRKAFPDKEKIRKAKERVQVIKAKISSLTISPPSANWREVGGAKPSLLLFSPSFLELGSGSQVHQSARVYVHANIVFLSVDKFCCKTKKACRLSYVETLRAVVSLLMSTVLTVHKNVFIVIGF